MMLNVIAWTGPYVQTGFNTINDAMLHDLTCWEASIIKNEPMFTLQLLTLGSIFAKKIKTNFENWSLRDLW